VSSASPTNLLKVFLDSSILIAAAISATGSARDLLRFGLIGLVELAVSSLVLQETQRNLARKAPETLPLYTQSFLPALAPRCIEPPPALVRRVAQAIVAKDAPIVAAAVAAGANYLVSYDRKHLLAQAVLVKSTFNVSVVTPDVVIALIAT
jgi:predicted nucleic acid-binding protein